MQIQSMLGKKTYQKSGFLQDGQRVPLTGVAVAGNFVTQIKTTEVDGYSSLQLGLGTNKKAKKRIVNHSKKAGLKETPRFLKEILAVDMDGITAGMEINIAEVFTPGDLVDVTGTSKGKGWAGGVKRWGFHGGPRTHGQSDRERAPGSIGQTTTPGRVYRGKKMAGRMGTETVTIKNLEIIDVTSDGMLLIKGLVPGFVNGYVVVKKVGENKKFVPMYRETVEAAEPAGDGDNSLPHVSGDAQPSEEAQSAESASLSDSSATAAEETQAGDSEQTVDSPENGQTAVSADESTSGTVEEGQAPVAPEAVPEEIPAEEVKEEVSSDAKAMDDKK